MRKLVLGLVLSLVLALALVALPACGGNGDDEEGETPTPGVTPTPTPSAVTYTTYTDPEYGFSIDVPEGWVSMTHDEMPSGVNAETGETLTVAEVMEATGGLLPYYLGWRAPTVEYGVYPHMSVPVYALPMPFPPEGFWGMMLEPDGFYDLFPELDIVLAEGVRTAEDRAAFWASFTWTDADGHAIRTLVCFVSKAGNMYMLGGITTEDTWDQYEDIFEHVVLSFKVPQ